MSTGQRGFEAPEVPELPDPLVEPEVEPALEPDWAACESALESALEGKPPVPDPELDTLGKVGVGGGEVVVGEHAEAELVADATTDPTTGTWLELLPLPSPEPQIVVEVDELSADAAGVKAAIGRTTMRAEHAVPATHFARCAYV